jgi:hypothetical protein
MAEQKRGYERLLEAEDPFVALEIGINNQNSKNTKQQELPPLKSTQNTHNGQDLNNKGEKSTQV